MVIAGSIACERFPERLSPMRTHCDRGNQPSQLTVTMISNRPARKLGTERTPNVAALMTRSMTPPSWCADQSASGTATTSAMTRPITAN